MKRWLSFLGLAAAAALLVGAGMQETSGQDVTVTSSGVSCTAGCGPNDKVVFVNHEGDEFAATSVLVINRGSNEVYIQLVDSQVGSLTQGTSELLAGESKTFFVDPKNGIKSYRRIGLLASSGESTTVRVEAYR